MVSYTDTVVYPGAMVIKSFYTLMTDCTVSASYSSQYLALGTELGGIEIFN